MPGNQNDAVAQLLGIADPSPAGASACVPYAVSMVMLRAKHCISHPGGLAPGDAWLMLKHVVKRVVDAKSDVQEPVAALDSAALAGMAFDVVDTPCSCASVLRGIRLPV